jgi:manganese/zinc/iron transport system permease protein
MSGLTAWLDANADSVWTVVVGILCNVPCAILGCYLVLRRMSLLGDAISHAVLPGLALAFLLTKQLNGPAMAIGAAVMGVLTTFLTQVVHKAADVPEDAGMGVVFTSLFAVGVILITRAASSADLDPGCVLYGLIEFTPLDTVPLFGREVPRAVQTLGPALLATIGFVAVFWKELKLVSFDPALAAAMGFRVALIHYMLMAMVAGVTVASFEAVGSILVIAMLIVPAATAHLLSDRLGGMIGWSVAVAVLSAVLGYLGAVKLNTSVAGMMAVAAGGLFLLAVLFAPRHGLMGQVVRRTALALRIARDHLLAALYRAEEAGVPAGPFEPSWVRRLAAFQLRRAGRIERHPGGWRLTPTGRAEGVELVRAHRLWEAFMSTRLGLPADHVHAPADRMEHYTDPALRDQLASDLAFPTRDPHGRPIPPPASDAPGR